MTNAERSKPAPPVWADVDGEAICPLCDYNLRGLTEPRCPECGYRFAWAEILDPELRHHPCLFEHHPERPVWSFWKTMVGSRRPRRFWRSLFPMQPSRPRRLYGYWAVIAALYLLAIGLQLSAYCISSARWQIRWNASVRASITPVLTNPRTPSQRQRANEIIKQYGSVQRHVDTQLPVTVNRHLVATPLAEVQYHLDYWVILLFPLIWPWLLLSGLLIFRISMRRAKIKSIHVVRCALYSCDGVIWLGLALVAGAGYLLTVSRSVSEIVNMARVLFWLYCAFVLTSGYRLWMGYRLYLRFEHPFGTVLASHAVALLILINVLTLMYVITNSQLLRPLFAPVS